MTTSNRQKTQVPNFSGGQFTNKDGTLTDAAKVFFSQLITSLQYILSTEGIRVPSQPSNKLPLLKTPGAIIYTSDTHVLEVNLNGTFHQITTS